MVFDVNKTPVEVIKGTFGRAYFRDIANLLLLIMRVGKSLMH